MNILVTGASGRIGKVLVPTLREQGHRVTCFDVRVPDRSRIDPGISWIQGNLAKSTGIKELLKGQDVVIHLGAYMSWDKKENKKLFSSNVQGTFFLLEGCVQNSIKKFVFISSGEVYPESKPEYLPIDENHPRKPTSFYGETKLIGEELVQYYTRAYHLQSVILRISHTQSSSELLDPSSFFSGPRFFLSARIARAKRLRNLAELDVLQSFWDGKEKLILPVGTDGKAFKMHITETRDIVQGILLAITTELPPGEVFNIGYDFPVPFDVYIPRMSQLIRIPYVTVPFPYPSVWYETSNAKAKRLLGYSPKWSFDLMLEQAAKFHRKAENPL